MIRRQTRRAGNSLMEVLVGFGILGIAATSVIATFPFSVLTIGHALRDDRTTTCATMADGTLRDIHRSVVEQGDTSNEPYIQQMDNPPGLQPVPRDSAGPSHPVFVDPMGFVANGGPVGDPPTRTAIPRVSLQMIQGSSNPPAMALRYCSLLDGLTYNDDGTVPGGFDMREMKYNWAWMLQRPVNRDRFTVRMQVVVFNNRTHLYRPPGTEEVHTGVVFTPGETAIVNVPLTANVRKGSWILDTTYNPNHIDIDPSGVRVGRPLRHAEFYRVLSVTNVGGTLSLEVHKPVARPDGLIHPPNTALYRYTGTLVSMPGVADVFERQPLTAATGP